MVVVKMDCRKLLEQCKELSRQLDQLGGYFQNEGVEYDSFMAEDFDCEAKSIIKEVDIWKTEALIFMEKNLEANEDKRTTKKLVIHTDGGAKDNGSENSVASFGVCARLYENDKMTSREIYTQRVDGKTNNQMEMAAMTIALATALKSDATEVEIHTDSNYVLKGLTEWIQGWKRNGWKNSSKQPVKNSELWIKMDKFHNDAIEKFGSDSINILKVKAHSNDYFNEHIDSICTWSMSELNNKEIKRQTITEENDDWKDVWN